MKRWEAEMKTRWGLAVIVIAVIWAAVILAVSMVLEGAPQSSQVLTVLGGGAAATIILLGGIAVQARKFEQ
jgi:hypothetical protein